VKLYLLIFLNGIQMLKKIITAFLFILLFYINCKSTETTVTIQKKPEKSPAVVYGCIEGNCANGFGTFTWENGSRYIGEFRNGNMHGQGTFLFGASNAGTKYTGELKNGFIDGFGTWTWPNGEKYIGESKFNKMHGKGTYYYSDGTIRTGTWFNDKYIKE
jgi:hypothetical protein